MGNTYFQKYQNGFLSYTNRLATTELFVKCLCFTALSGTGSRSMTTGGEETSVSGRGGRGGISQEQSIYLREREREKRTDDNDYLKFLAT